MKYARYIAEKRDTSLNGTVSLKRTLLGLVAAVATSGLVACGGGASTEALPVTGVPPVSDYTGPPPATPDVQSFRLNVWENLKANNRCGACHSVAGGQAPMFVRTDDVNLAYAEANNYVDLTQPQNSQMVTKVAGGHNCWLTSDAACSDILTTWITAWAGDAIAGGGTQIQLEAPPLIDVGDAKTFPADSGLFSTTVHPILTQYCQDCHASSSSIPQTPYFAESDPDSAYDAARSKINLDDPSLSRFVMRLSGEFHNCWTDCTANASEMQTAIEAFSNAIPLTQVDPSLVLSKALTLYDGTVASGGNRYEANVIANYEFKTGSGNTAFDTSGVEPALNLTFSGQVEWMGGWGINIVSGKAQGTTTASKKIHDLIQATGEYTIEGWVVPGNVVQEEAVIVGYSAGTTARNFTMSQTLYSYDALNRSSVTDGNGQPQLSTAAADEDLQATLQHVAITYDPVNGRQIFVNAVYTDDVDDIGGGTLGDWDDTFAFVLGNEVSSDRQWVGALRQVAIHNRALTQGQIQQNFDAGVGEKFFLLFYVGDLISVPDSYILFEVAQFDSYSYLFNEPVFISLDSSAQPDGIPVRGMRIGINGAESPVSQTYGKMDTMITSASYTAAGQALSPMGSIIGLQKGPALDQFFLTFEVLGSNTNVRTEPAPLVPPPPPDGPEIADIGVRTFDEINLTMSLATTISQQNSDVMTTYDLVRQQLPVVEAIDTFSSAHQVGVAQLAIEYCNALVDDTGARSSYFGGFNFGADASQAFDTTAERDQILDPLLSSIMGLNVGTQPDPNTVKGELNSLIDNLTACGGSCGAGRTETVVKAVCAGALGSATMLVQ